MPIGQVSRDTVNQNQSIAEDSLIDEIIVTSTPSNEDQSLASTSELIVYICNNVNE